jgi:hypothetical protein
MAYSNSDILAAVLSRYVQPIAIQFAQAKISSWPVIQGLENKAKASGWVSSNWSIANEISAFVEPVTNAVARPLLKQYLSNIPDAAIPEMAHGLVDKAIQNGGLELMEGRLKFDMNDLRELKNLLDYNLPLQKKEEYEVITSKKKEENPEEIKK